MFGLPDAEMAPLVANVLVLLLAPFLIFMVVLKVLCRGGDAVAIPHAAHRRIVTNATDSAKGL
jgi:hypothetical protein